MRCLLVDDEPLALDILEHYLKRYPDQQIIARCNSASEAQKILDKEKIDLMFLDIQMPGQTGIEFLKTLAEPPLVIFTTAYEQYALQGYELDVIDYLVKPIPPDRFEKAISKAEEFLKFKNSKQFGENPPKEYMFVRSEHQTVKVNFADIRYIEGLKDYVKIHVGTKPLFVHQNLKSIESSLPPDQFLRVHKSYIVSLQKIQAFKKGNLVIGEVMVPVGDTYREKVMEKLKI